jgi:aminoglycoside 6'-N-acetyltransferase
MIFGERVRLRPATGTDATRFGEILSHPDVARWWGDYEEEVAEQVASMLDPPEDTSTFAIEFGGSMVGVIQCWEELEPQYRHAGIDLAVHPDWHGRGIGTDAVHALATHLLRDRGHHRLTIDPAAHNEVAIRVYQRIGFRPVGIMRRYERGPDGTWHNGLLMDLLADELTAPVW